jgi:hypothetical protein
MIDVALFDLIKSLQRRQHSHFFLPQAKQKGGEGFDRWWAYSHIHPHGGA